jgi:hypothetical protein
MDIVTLHPTNYRPVKLIQNLNSVEWIERYNEPGEFTITAEVTPTLMTDLALGKLISHVDTLDIMIVESHMIDESKNSDDPTVIEIKGRSLFSLLENRIASGSNSSEKKDRFDVATGTNVEENILYDFLPRTTVANLVVLLQDHITSGIISASDRLLNTTVSATFTGTDTTKDMVVKRGQLYSEVVKLLEQIDAGLKVTRPPQGTTQNALWQVHKGVDVSNNVIFASEFGDLEKTKYFWSQKTWKNSALVVGEWTYKVMRAAGLSGTDMRVLYVDATDYDFKPTGSSADLLLADNVLTRRGEEALAENRKQVLIETSIVPNSRYKYRKNYNIGDIVYIAGNYGISSKMRVVEYAEFWDESGETGVPTVKSIY